MSYIIVDMIQYFFFQMVLNKVTTILKFFSTSNLSSPIYLFTSQISTIPLEKTTQDPRMSRTHLSFTNKTTVDETGVRGDDLEVLMVNLGVSGGEKLPEVLNYVDMFNIFEEEGPRLDEVKEAFDVFDENRDGFIDAWELHRVMSVLGLKERMEMEDCRKMIGVVDENSDGRIDFDEFVKLMENTFC